MTRWDTLRVASRDTVRLVDSVFMKQWTQGDTVYISKEKTVYRCRIRVDTVYSRRDVETVKTDSVSVPVPVERPLSKWEQWRKTVKKNVLHVVMGGVVLAVFTLWNRRKIPK